MKTRAERHVTAAMVITDLRSSLVAMSSIEHAGANNPTRDAYALAREHAAAALDGIETLRGEARSKVGEIASRRGRNVR